MKVEGFRGFVTIWLGQFASLFGSGLTSFALTIWIFQQTESPTALALAAFFSRVPMLVFGPISGALADRYSRKALLVLSDSMAGAATLVLALSCRGGNLELWIVYLTLVISGIADSIQVPALLGSITLMVPRAQYGRASGLQSLAGTASNVFAPIAAAGLLSVVDLSQILWIDLLTFGMAILTLAITKIPQPAGTEVGVLAEGSFLKDMAYGFKFIFGQPSLRGLQAIWMGANFLATIGNVLVAPLVLTRSGGSNFALSGVEAILSAGAVAGGIVISLWGGPKKRVPGALICMAFSGFLGRICFGFGRDLLTWIPGAFFMFFFIPILNGCLAPVWLAKVPPDVQGRVMSARITLSRSMVPLGTLLAGPLAEFVFEPAMMDSGILRPIFAGFAGTGPGAGMSLLLILTGLLMLGLAWAGFSVPAVRDAETLLPDFTPSKNQD